MRNFPKIWLFVKLTGFVFFHFVFMSLRKNVIDNFSVGNSAEKPSGTSALSKIGKIAAGVTGLVSTFLSICSANEAPNPAVFHGKISMPPMPKFYPVPQEVEKKSPQFVSGAFVEFEGKYYFVEEADEKNLTLKDVQTAESAPLTTVCSEDFSKVKSVQPSEIIAKIAKTFPQGKNATEIAQALGLKKWEAGSIAGNGETHTDDKKLPAGQALWALQDQRVLTALTEQFQDFLNQFKPGERYLFAPEGAEAKECEIVAVQKSDLVLRAKHKGKMLNFRIKPQDWSRVNIHKVGEAVVQKEQVKMEVAKTEKHEKVAKPDIVFSSKKELLTEVLKKDSRLAKMLSVYFSRSHHTAAPSMENKKQMAVSLDALLTKAEKIIDEVVLPIELQNRVEKTLGKNWKNDLTTLILSETNGDHKAKMFPCDLKTLPGGTWGYFKMGLGYLKVAHQDLKNILGYAPDFAPDFKFQELKQAYNQYLREAKQNKKQAYANYEKRIQAINSPVMDTEKATQLFLARTVTVLEKINGIEGAQALSDEEKRVFLGLNYLSGEGLFTKNLIPRYAEAKKANPNLSIYTWLKKIGYKESVIKSLYRKIAPWLASVQMEELKQTSLLSQVQSFYKTYKAEEATQEIQTAKVTPALAFVEGEIPDTAANRQMIVEHKEDLNLLKTLLNKSGIEKNSRDAFVRKIIAGIVNNPGTNCADALQYYIDKYSVKEECASLVQGLANVKNRLCELSQNQSAQIAQVETKPEKVCVAGEIVLEEAKKTFANLKNRITNGFRTKAQNVLEDVMPQQESEYERAA